VSLCNWVDERIEVECRQIGILCLYEDNVWHVIPIQSQATVHMINGFFNAATRVNNITTFHTMQYALTSKNTYMEHRATNSDNLHFKASNNLSISNISIFQANVCLYLISFKICHKWYFT